MYIAFLTGAMACVLLSSVLGTALLVTFGSRQRRKSLLTRKPNSLAFDSCLYLDEGKRLLAIYLMEELAMEIGVELDRIFLTDGFYDQLAFFQSRKVQWFADQMDVGWAGVQEDVVLRMNYDGFDCDLDFRGSVGECIENSSVRVRKEGSGEMR